MQSKSIGEIALSIGSGLTPLRNDERFWCGGTIPWLKTEQLGEKLIYDTSEKITELALQETSIKLNPENAISIAMYGEGKTRGSVSIIKTPMTTNQACCNVVLNPELADFEYVYYYLKTQYENLRQLSSGVRKNLNSGDIRNFVIRLPNEVAKQKKIAGVLAALDAKIDLNQRINIELEALAKSVYDYWFVQFDFPDEQGRPYKTSGGSMVRNEALNREIPVGWEMLTLASLIAKQKNGEWGESHFSESSNTQVTCFRGADINALNGDGELNAATRYIASSKTEKLLASHDLVIEISGGSPTQSTGRSALISPEVMERFDTPLVCSNFCKALTLKEPERAYEFLQCWKALYSAGVFFGWEGKTSGIKNLQFDSFVSNHFVPVAPQPLSTKFYQFVRSLEKRKQIGLRENYELSALRDWLLPLLMNGQVRRKDAVSQPTTADVESLPTDMNDKRTLSVTML